LPSFPLIIVGAAGCRKVLLEIWRLILQRRTPARVKRGRLQPTRQELSRYPTTRRGTNRLFVVEDEVALLFEHAPKITTEGRPRFARLEAA
jgi:hypothetical protein